MFTGLIEHCGTVEELKPSAGSTTRLCVTIGPLNADGKMKTGDSVAVNGCCLTAVDLSGEKASFEAVPETLRRTTLGLLKCGNKVNLERALRAGDRMGGHFVQGHVDGTVTVVDIKDGDRWREMHLQINDTNLVPTCQIVEKGSVALEGVSLTVAGKEKDGSGKFHVALIPETLGRTTLGAIQKGDQLNIETDILAKYVQESLSSPSAKSSITKEKLKDWGYE